MLVSLRHYLSLVRFSHTLFALPFALASLFWAAQGWPGWRVFMLVLLCMVFARNAAMAFNRLADARFDAQNPRTAGRHLPAGVLSRSGVTVFLGLNAALFVGATWLLNPLAFALSVPALAAVCFYSVTKRFTSWSHLYLGLAIGISPVGAWIAARGSFGSEALLLCLALLLWIAGFDIIYATQDEEFDRRAGLHSMAVRLGRAGAIRLSAWLHLACFAVLVLIERVHGLGWPYRIALAVVGLLLVWLHRYRRSDSLDGLNQDFFLGNVAISLCIFAGVTVSVFLSA